MPEGAPSHEGEGVVVHDETYRVTDVAKARTMAADERTPEGRVIHEGSNRARSDAEVFKKSAEERKRLFPDTEFITDHSEKANELTAQAENIEHSNGLHYEADKIVDAVGENVSFEAIYTNEQRAAEAQRDVEALQRVYEGLFDKPGRERDAQSLKRSLSETQDQERIYHYAFSKLRGKGMEQLAGGHKFWDEYNDFKAKKLATVEKK